MHETMTLTETRGEKSSPRTKVVFAGAGPGAPDLITVRAMNALKEADLVLYAGSLVNPDILSECKSSCELADSSHMTLEEQTALLSSHAKKGEKVVRLHSGDPSLYGAIAEQMALLKKDGVECEVIPGVTAACAAAATLGCELTVPEISQSLVITRSSGRTPLPEAQRPAAFAKTGATLAFYLSAGHFARLCEELMQDGGLAPDTPCAIVSRASWPDELILRGTLADIVGKADAAGVSRQALLIVGKAVEARGETLSRLYDSPFSHGYRNDLADERFTGSIGVVAFSAKGRLKAREICQGLGEQAQMLESVKDFRAAWEKYAGFVCVGASGLVVRIISPLLKSKAKDPAIVTLDERGRFVVSLCGGHLAGANRLARRVARITQGTPVISTATDTEGHVAFDEAAAREEARVVNTRAILACNRALLDREPVDFFGPRAVYDRYWHDTEHVRFRGSDTVDQASEAGRTGETTIEEPKAPAECAVFWDQEPTGDYQHALQVSTRTFVLGVGLHNDLEPERFLDAARAYLSEKNVDPARLACVASLAVKGNEHGVRLFCQTYNLPFMGATNEELARQEDVLTRSATVERYMGTPSVAEASSLWAARRHGRTGRLLGPRESHDKVMTFALAQIGHNTPESASVKPFETPPNASSVLPKGMDEPGAQARDYPVLGHLSVVGLGSGERGHLTEEAARVLCSCEVVVGYSTYMDMARSLLFELESEGRSVLVSKDYIESGMRGEIERCRMALDEAAKGRHVALVSSGDPGLLAMAGLVLELKVGNPAYRSVNVRIFPGVTAAFLAAARLGAPLQNGAVLVSLSDLLVPSDEVRLNVKKALESALPLAVYNPAGKKRRALLKETIEMARAIRGEKTLVSLVRHAGKRECSAWVGTLSDLDEAAVDMFTLVLIGDARSRYEEGYFFESRGYADKYSGKMADRA